MRWKQFFTPVQSFDTDQARKYISANSYDAFTILDVRQPNEYKGGHIPGAKLIPLPDLTERLNEIDADKPAIVYCAIGGRSRVAAQILTVKGFDNVYNLSGGFKAWDSKAAFGGKEQGLELFSGNESSEKTLIVAYSLEAGLRDFYLSMLPKISNEDVQKLFQKLSDIEVKHQERIFDEYLNLTGKSDTQAEFEKNVVVKAMEGGLTTEEYPSLFTVDWESVIDIIDLAMSIEAQALDLYMRAAEKSQNLQSKNVLTQIADEEQIHLKQLGKMIENL
ncbi:rhodanese-like domain-containing protein [Thermodesulfobacteriota bacterium]